MNEDPDAAELFATVELEYGASVATESDGDLWPCAWADDGSVYTANGDGAGFSDGSFEDIVVNRVVGDVASGLTGERLAAGRAVSPIWGDPALVNAKPTGIVAVDGDGDGRDELYLAVQDLPGVSSPEAFDRAPAASIVRSDDRGRTWVATRAPMFTDHVFTTVMFLDFGRSNGGSRALGPDDAPYVYAYGLDGNWRASYGGHVPDPQDLYLARVGADRIQDRSAWRFFAGRDPDGRPLWSSDIDRRVAVLTDRRRLYPETDAFGVGGQPVIGQGGVVYNAPLGTYFFSSWSEYTFQLYAADRPWGPWRLFHEQDFGPFPWRGPRDEHPRHGGYGTTIPSRYISADGRTMWLQSNWFWRADAYSGNSYHFSLRRLRVTPFDTREPENPVAPDANLASPATGAVPAVSMCHGGNLGVLNDGTTERSEDSWNGRRRKVDHWGYRWPRRLTLDTVVLTSGPRDYNSGWFAETPRVQARVGARWVDVPSMVEPRYPADPTATGYRRYAFRFAPLAADGIRVVGAPAGDDAYTTVSELEVYRRG
jgi:hypothetical protein